MVVIPTAFELRISIAHPIQLWMGDRCGRGRRGARGMADGQVWVINSDGTGSKQLTEDCSHRNSDDPSWSPDGKKILFSTGRSGRNELWVMDADGSNEKRISDIEAFPFPGRASWQPFF
ncbi:MAG TPA: hypothetical protein VK138_07240 [Acidiferrobacterales bacterium]|nr:hypothetical protein [Acidiferrobacterales bacterium]